MTDFLRLRGCKDLNIFPYLQPKERDPTFIHLLPEHSEMIKQIKKNVTGYASMLFTAISFQIMKCTRQLPKMQNDALFLL